MRKKLRSCIALLGALSMVASFGVQVASAAEADYPDMEVGVFWNSDSDRSDTVYMSYNGADFQQISTAYKADGNGSAHVSGKPNYVNAIHDPSITYKEWYILDSWRLCAEAAELGMAFYPDDGIFQGFGELELP